MAAGDLMAPIIPLLENNTLDPDKLNGGPLATYAKYSAPSLGDTLYQSWLGLDNEGNPVDVTDIPILVDPENEGEHGFLMEIANHFVQLLNKGQVFYSFYLERFTGEPKEESKRIHFGIGKDGWLSAPQIKESHDSQLDPRPVPAYPNMTIAMVPYAAMSNGDKVKLVWKGRRANGQVGPSVNIPLKTLNDTDTDPTNNPGQVLSWQVPTSNLIPLENGSIALHYEITHASNTTQAVTLSAERSILVTAPAAPELPKPDVKDLKGTEIVPKDFPDGITVVVPIYPGIRIGDDVLVYGTRTGAGSNPSKNTIQSLQIDGSNIGSGKIEVLIPHRWLQDNLGGNVTLRYQYARVDAAGSGIPLELTVRAPLQMPTPTVDNSVLAGGRDELDPMRAFSGAFIAIPKDAAVDGYPVTAHWKGFGASGSCDIPTPSQFDPMKFKVPREFIPPNFGRTVEVTYSVPGQDAERALQLYIRKLINHPGIECEKAQIGSPATLSLRDIPDSGVLLTVDLWPFISTAQKVRLWLTAGAIGDRDIIPVRSVTFEETTGRVKARLFKTDLSGIAMNGYFKLSVSVSFDEGHTFGLSDNYLDLKLLT
jgi:hypothetical protein